VKTPPDDLADRLLGASELILAGSPPPRFDDIAERIGVARATLYYYFSGRDDLLSFVLTEHIRRGAAIIAAADGGSPAERLRVTVAGLVRFLGENPELCPALLSAMGGAGRMREALAADWNAAVETLAEARSLFVLGRGPSLAIAGEVALKFKETCGIHAEAYSAAEVMHGPVELVEPGFPVLALAGRDTAEASVAQIADDLAAQGAAAFATTALCRKAARLPVPEAGHPLLDALIQVVPAYLFIEALSRRRGRNPDAPRRLRKVTETV